MPTFSTEKLRRRLSEVVSRAAFGCAPVLISRRGRRIAAMISLADLAFLQRMRRKDEELFSRARRDSVS